MLLHPLRVGTVPGPNLPITVVLIRHRSGTNAHGEHVADVVLSGEIEQMRETIDVLSGSELVRDLREGLADIATKWVGCCGPKTTAIQSPTEAQGPTRREKQNIPC